MSDAEKKPRRTKNTAKKGARNENLVMDAFAEAGALVVVRGAASKCKGSHAAKIDVVAVFPRLTYLAQVKTNEWEPGPERDDLAALASRVGPDQVVVTVRVNDGGGGGRKKEFLVRFPATGEKTRLEWLLGEKERP